MVGFVTGSTGNVTRISLNYNNLTGMLSDLSPLSYLEYISLTGNPRLQIDSVVTARLDQLRELYLPPQQYQDSLGKQAPLGPPVHHVAHEGIKPIEAPPTDHAQQWPMAARYWRVRQHSYLPCVTHRWWGPCDNGWEVKDVVLSTISGPSGWGSSADSSATIVSDQTTDPLGHTQETEGFTNAGHEPSKAFDGDDTTFWRSQRYSLGWVGQRFSNPVVVKAVRVATLSHSNNVHGDPIEYLPKSIAVERSIDGKAWEVVKLFAHESEYGRSLENASKPGDAFTLETNLDHASPGQPVHFHRMQSATVSSGSVSCSSSSNWAAGVSSSAVFVSTSAVKGVEFICATSGDVIFGLSADDTLVGSNTYTEIQWGLRCNGGTLSVYEAGSDRGSFGSYSSTTKLAVRLNSDPGVLQRQARLIEYIRDGELIYTSTVIPDIARGLLVDVACHTAMEISSVTWVGEELWKWPHACGQSSSDCANSIDTKYSTSVLLTPVVGSWLSFDLGSWKAVSGIKMYKPNGGPTTGIKDFVVEVSDLL